MRRAVTLGIFFSLILIGTIFLNVQVPIGKSANFVGQTIYLKADGSIEPSDAPVDVHGTTYTLTGDIQCPSFGYCIYIEKSGILLDGDGYTIEGWNPENEPIASSSAIYAGFVSNIEIRNIIVKGCASGIEVQSVSQANIHNTTIDGESQTEGSEAIGISIMSCDGASIDQNYILNNYNALLVQSSNCSITNNRIMHNSGAGVYLTGSENKVLSNLIAKNEIGIEIAGSNNLIQDNDILSNKRIGILTAPNNLFTGNNIAGQNSTNAYGVQMGPYDGGSTFYHNDFENNYIQVEGGDFAPIANVWDNGYSSGGNYWDTYQGVDSYIGVFQNETGSDGIGDTPYEITSANIDHYPLMQPVRPNPDISEETTPQNDYTLAIMIIILIVVSTFIALIIIYWRRRKKKTPKETIPAQQKTLLGKLSVPVPLTLSIIIILNFAFITAGTYQLGSVELYGGALYFDEILIGFLSSITGLFLTWRIIIRQEYTAGRLRETLSAILISVLLGGIGLKRTQAHSGAAIAYLRLASGLIIVFAGLLTGYAAGYIIWAAFGQIQTVMGASFSYWAVFPPPLPFLLVWAVVGAIVFPIGIWVKRAKSR
jgi:parallel beta-helix repeat protein